MSNKSAEPTLLIFARKPEHGKCKTRLIPAVGEITAAKIHAELIRRTVSNLCQSQKYNVQLWCFPDVDHPLFESLSSRYGIKLYTQQGNELGEKMFYALSVQDGPSILVGTDIPGMNADYIDSANRKLAAGCDVVIGPAEDGGYTLIAVKKAHYPLFEGIPWGTNDVFRVTCQKMTEAGLHWDALETLWDVDTPEDLERYHSL